MQSFILRLIIAALLFANGFNAGVAYRTPQNLLAAFENALRNAGEGFEPGPML